MNVLNRHLTPDYTVCDLLNTVMELDARNTQALLDYAELLLLRNNMKRVK